MEPFRSLKSRYKKRLNPTSYQLLYWTFVTTPFERTCALVLVFWKSLSGWSPLGKGGVVLEAGSLGHGIAPLSWSQSAPLWLYSFRSLVHPRFYEWNKSQGHILLCEMWKYTFAEGWMRNTSQHITSPRIRWLIGCSIFTPLSKKRGSCHFRAKLTWKIRAFY